MSTNAKLDDVLAYIKSEFPDFSITKTNPTDRDTFIEIKSAAMVHRIHIQHDFLDNTPMNEIRDRLKGFRLAQILREMGNFPIIVSVNGCIFA